MELSAGKQRLLFAVVVIALAGLGIYLLGPGRSAGTSAPATPAAAASSAAAVAATPAPAVTAAQVAPSPLPVPTSVKSADIYSWLPFTQKDLDAAANVTQAFASAYETFSYTDTAQAFGRRISAYVTPEFLAVLQQQFLPPDARQVKLSSASSGKISQIASFGSSPQASITFVVAITEDVTSSGRTSAVSGQYDVTTVAVPGGWQVANIQQAGAGNQ